MKFESQTFSAQILPFTSTVATMLSPQPRRPRIAVTLGDTAGIGPELIAKLLSNHHNLQKADVVLLADRSELDSAIADAGGVSVPTSNIVKSGSVQLLDDNSARQFPTPRGEVSKNGGARCLYQFRRALEMHADGDIDAIVFAPLNKSSLKLAGMTEEDELRWFAKQLNFTGTTSEINIAGSALWTARVTSHIGIESVAALITKENVIKAIELLHKLRWESGIESPRLGVCALNPHNGENGSFGRQEIDAIAPAVAACREKGIDVSGPFPCDTIFATRRSNFDGIVTMYHDQGQIALKLLSFNGGVTVQGGLPVVIATPAHGTAFDISGQNLASVASTQSAFDVAVTMAQRRMMLKAADPVSYASLKAKALPKVMTTEIHACC